MNSSIHDVRFACISDSQRAEALAMLVSAEPVAEQPGRIAAIVTTLRQADVSSATLVGAWRGEILTAVAWGQILPGRTALLWPTRLAARENDMVGDQLQAFLDERLEAAGIRMAQALLAGAEHSDARRLERAGYTCAAELLYLVSPLDHVELTVDRFEIDFVPYTPRDRERMSALIERTYTGTLDVPALDGVRDMLDVLDGYEQTGEFSPERWFFIRKDGEEVGCLLLNDHPLQRQWELVYMGIVPQSRGRGWGVQATRFAQQLAKSAGRERLILAVDAANDPAVNAYTKAGFFQLLRRAVFLRVF